MPKISVLIPVFKTTPEYLKEAISSVLDQTFQDFELIILDDCPEDNREDVISSFEDVRIRYFKNEKNVGISASRNKLIDLAKGEYLAIMDHDDVALPDRFLEQVKILDSCPDIGVVGCWVERFPKIEEVHYPEKNPDIERYLMQGCAVPHTGAMIRKSILEDIRYESEFSPSEDYALWCRLLKKTQFYNVPKILMRYRWHKNNTSHLRKQQMKEKTQSIHFLVRNKCQDLWQDVCDNSLHFVRLKLFGIIPIAKYIQKGNRPAKFLKYVPFITFKIKMVL